MNKPCPSNNIRNQATGRCVANDSILGRRIMGINSPFKYEPALKYKVGTIDKFNKGYDFSKDSCNKNLNNKHHQCDCPICWIVSSITAIVFSGLLNLCNKKYKDAINDAYLVFITPDETKCPYLPIEILKRYKEVLNIYGLDKGLDIYNINSSSGYAKLMILSLLETSLSKKYKIMDSYDYINIDKQVIEIDYGDNDIIIQQAEVNIKLLQESKKLLSTLNIVQLNLIKRGFIFNSGTFNIISTDPSEEIHSIAFSYCNRKYYACNTDKRECIDISNEEEYINYFTRYYKNYYYNYITFIIKRLNL